MNKKKKKIMKVSAGIMLVLNNEKLLLCHPSNAALNTNFSFPKGGVNDGESLIDAAIRETMEETSVAISKSQISNKENPFVVDYINKDRSIYKRVYLYRVDIKSLSEVGLKSEVIEKDKLQASEISWAGFLNETDSKSKIFRKCKNILNEIWK